MKPSTLSSAEKLLAQKEAIPNRNERQQKIIQEKVLDRETAQLQKSRELTQQNSIQEVKKINRELESRMREILGNEFYERWRSDTLESDPNNNNNDNNNNSNSSDGKKEEAPSSSTTHHSNDSLSTIKKKSKPFSMQNFLLGFPTPFAESGFQSLKQWAQVSFDEAEVTALGPTRYRKGGASSQPNTGPSPTEEEEEEEEVPNRLLAAVSCFILNEIMTNDKHFGEIWQKRLRKPIFDAVFSPQTLQQYYENDKKPFVSGLKHSKDQSEPRPTYEHVRDYALYTQWAEQAVQLRRHCQQLTTKLVGVSDIAKEGQTALLAVQAQYERQITKEHYQLWLSYTRQRRVRREERLQLYLAYRGRLLRETAFLKWRRVTLQGKVEALAGGIAAQRGTVDQLERTRKAAVEGLQATLEEERSKAVLQRRREEMLRAQLMETHLSESNALRLALGKKYRKCIELRNVARRWERLAKTLRPQRLCPAVPKGLLLLGVRVRRFEEELAIGATNIAFRSPLIHRTLELFLLRWVNGVMAKARERHYWHPVKALERTKLQLAHEPGLPPNTERKSFFTGVSLLYLVRELKWRYHLLFPQHFSTESIGGTMSNYLWLKQRGNTADGESNDRNNLEELDPVATPAPTTTFTFKGAPPAEDKEADERETVALNTLFSELLEVLYIPTQEGLKPPLLMHCPTLDQFFGPSHLLHPVAPVHMMWLLAALFVGYVDMLTNYDLSVTGTTTPQWPAYLQCRVEEDLAKGPHPVVSAAFYRNRNALKKCGSLSAQRGLANHLFGYKIQEKEEGGDPTSGTLTEEEKKKKDAANYQKTQGSKVVSTSTRMGKSTLAKKALRKKRKSGKEENEREEEEEHEGEAPPRTMQNYLLAKQARKGADKAGTTKYAKQLAEAEAALNTVDLHTLEHLSLVEDGYDTTKDIKVYIGIDNDGGEWETSDSDSDANVDALMRHVSEVEDRRTTEKRKQIMERDRRRQDKLISSGGLMEVEDLDTPPVTLVVRKSKGKSSALQADKLNDSMELALPSLRGKGGESADTGEVVVDAADDSNAFNEDEVNDLLLYQKLVEHDGKFTNTTVSATEKKDDDVTTKEKKGKTTKKSTGEAEDSSEEGEDSSQPPPSSDPPDENQHIDAHQINLLQHLPPPSVAFDIRDEEIYKFNKQFHPLMALNNGIRRRKRSTEAREEEEKGEGGNTPHITIQEPDIEPDATAASTRGEDKSTIKKKKKQLKKGKKEWKSIRIQEDPNTMHVFLSFLIQDRQRRTRWLGLSRIITSLVTRVRVLDEGVSTHTSGTAEADSTADTALSTAAASTAPAGVGLKAVNPLGGSLRATTPPPLPSQNKGKLSPALRRALTHSPPQAKTLTGNYAPCTVVSLDQLLPPFAEDDGLQEVRDRDRPRAAAGGGLPPVRGGASSPPTGLGGSAASLPSAKWSKVAPPLHSNSGQGLDSVQQRGKPTAASSSERKGSHNNNNNNNNNNYPASARPWSKADSSFDDDEDERPRSGPSVRGKEGLDPHPHPHPHLSGERNEPNEYDRDTEEVECSDIPSPVAYTPAYRSRRETDESVTVEDREGREVEDDSSPPPPPPPTTTTSTKVEKRKEELMEERRSFQEEKDTTTGSITTGTTVVSPRPFLGQKGELDPLYVMAERPQKKGNVPRLYQFELKK